MSKKQRIADLEKRITELEARIASLEARSEQSAGANQYWYAVPYYPPNWQPYRITWYPYQPPTENDSSAADTYSYEYGRGNPVPAEAIQ